MTAKKVHDWKPENRLSRNFSDLTNAKPTSRVCIARHYTVSDGTWTKQLSSVCIESRIFSLLVWVGIERNLSFRQHIFGTENMKTWEAGSTEGNGRDQKNTESCWSASRVFPTLVSIQERTRPANSNTNGE